MLACESLWSWLGSGPVMEDERGPRRAWSSRSLSMCRPRPRPDRQLEWRPASPAKRQSVVWRLRRPRACSARSDRYCRSDARSCRGPAVPRSQDTNPASDIYFGRRFSNSARLASSQAWNGRASASSLARRRDSIADARLLERTTTRAAAIALTLIHVIRVGRSSNAASHLSSSLTTNVLPMFTLSQRLRPAIVSESAPSPATIHLDPWPRTHIARVSSPRTAVSAPPKCVRPADPDRLPNLP